ncbi:hypothetical protein GV794_15755 [Nocardia cyriacigeorgica]|uniref:Uncharacterized protein n=1 Tax=Nocardia cyriacigeorgica TaxID=135487 RepID=A0A6P1DEY3_9NOCA|nr:hypothetical protein [Nocardia cyriacigeorgica]NEW41965.1 hypothetical protein [Nocardia cyriacigeorgica]NEW46982.1 hypothetical protein [Nocardia cyriacigeorgica]NEW53005.1 hypothetical protein [Nocardia cyriacigeorgica]NEW57099.1 hypothetical protein [Nocardia cyriacigeorgica]
MSTERGAVHAVALGEEGAKLSDRVLLHRVAAAEGDGKAELAETVSRALDRIAAEIGSSGEIAGIAVAYRDAAERRAIVTRLASGPWRSASMVSTKSAHLSVAGAMTWLNEFDNLLICEVVPGYQAFTLVDPGRRRVLAATGHSGAAVTMDTMRAAVTVARDQLDAAEVRPDAVVLIGSGADQPAVTGAVAGFGAPVIPCMIAGSAPAIGAALFAMEDLVDVVVPIEQARRQRGGGVALVAVAGVLASGLAGGGVYLLSQQNRHSGPAATDAMSAANSHTVDAEGTDVARPSVPAHPPHAPVRAPEPIAFQPSSATMVPETGSLHTTPRPQFAAPQWNSWPEEGRVPLVPAEPETAPAAWDPSRNSIVPEPQVKVGEPHGFLFPGESPPPPPFTAESYAWWSEHVRMLAQWAAEQVLPS